MKIALAHDSFTQMGGAERVIESLHKIYPKAPVFTLVFDKKYAKRFEGWDIRPSVLQKIYNLYPVFQHLLLFIPAALASLNFKNFEIIISSSSSFVKNITRPKNALHINYCHTPTRFLWSDQIYVNQEVGAYLRPIVILFLKWMKSWDFKAAQRVDYFIANSKEVQKRIKLYYNRESAVIYPAVDTEFWHPTQEKQNYFLIAGRLQAHKKNDLIIEIFNELGIPLHVVGIGRQIEYLKSIALQNITFLGNISDERLRDEYSGALGLIYPQIEDLGLMPIEAAGCGTATLGMAQAGSLETIIPGITGELFGEYNKEQIKNLVRSWDAKKYFLEKLSTHANNFSQSIFEQNIKEFVAKALNENKLA